MKKILLGCLIAGNLMATEYGFVNYSFADPANPYHVSSKARHVNKAKFKDESQGEIKYLDASASVYYSHPIDAQNIVTYGIGYDLLRIDWAQNPYFSTKDFHYTNASVGLVSSKIENWHWVLNAGVSVDTQRFDFGHTGVYHAMLAGRYHFSPQGGFHVGLVSWYGIRSGYALPIFGIDWRFNNKLTANCILPLNISLNYAIDNNWSIETAYSGFGGPYRYPRKTTSGLGRDPHPLFMFSSNGIDISLKYRQKGCVRAELGLGWNFGGWVMKKSKIDDVEKSYSHFKGAPYVQANIGLNF